MAKYLYIGSYTADGAKGALKDGGSARREAARHAVESVGGRLESYYFAFGTDDFFVTFEAPSAAAAAALALTVGGSGAVSGRTIPLIMPEELDAASKIAADYSPPGG
jgi:uncharacterized protein with GYD domain